MLLVFKGQQPRIYQLQAKCQNKVNGFNENSNRDKCSKSGQRRAKKIIKDQNIFGIAFVIGCILRLTSVLFKTIDLQELYFLILQI